MGVDAPDHPGNGDRAGRGPNSAPHEWGERVRAALQAKTADDVGRELPGLVDRLAATSREGDDTRRFLVGVSLSRNDTFLDYSLARVTGEARVETIKEPVSTEHRYLTFAYPPDPNFDAAALRGALLSSLEADLQALTEPDDVPRIARLWGNLHGDG